MRQAFLACGLSLAMIGLARAEEPKFVYPDSMPGTHVDTLHGVKVPDPYRWLEDDVRQSKKVADWVASQNRVTNAFLESIPERERIRNRLTELWNYPKFGLPFAEGGRFFFLKNDGLQSQSVLYMAESFAALTADKAKVLLDPNAWTKDGTVALAGVSPSDDGRYLAYCTAEAGSDWNTWRVIELHTGKLLADEIRWVKHSHAAWTPDGKGFFYARYPEPKPGAEFQDKNLNRKLFYHQIGRPQAQDELIYERPDQPGWLISGDVSEDGRYLVITMAAGTDARYRVAIKDLAQPATKPKMLIDNFDHEYSFLGNDGPVLYFKTDADAPRRRVVAIDCDKPAKENCREIIPQAEETLTDVSLVGNRFFASYLRDVQPLVKVFEIGGTFVRSVEFPSIGSASGFHGKRKDKQTFYVFSSFATPPSIYCYDTVHGESRLIRRADVKFRPEDYEVKQVFFKSKDGTRVPMFLAYRKGIAFDGARPTLLYGYGGFNISLPPAFSVSRLAWMEMGGVYAQANLRGGGEYGEPWHQAGVKEKKQNVFDDFIAAAEWLIANKITRPDKLAVQGGSNGGLLVGAVMTQRPELFGACLPAVGVMDMLRFHLFTGGRLWIDDFGSADDPSQFKALLAYSPYHNLRPGTRYPATMVTTGDTDDRVVPSHSFKFAAALQKAQAGPAPTLIRIETRAGHGAGKPTAKKIAETADELAFLVKTLGMKLPDAPNAATIRPGENLVTEGIPPIAAETAAQSRRYTESRSAQFVDWNPLGSEMIIATRFGNTTQLHTVAMPGGARRQITFEEEPVTWGSFDPRDGKYVLFSKDTGGNEFHQLYRFDPAEGKITLLTDGGRSQNGGVRWSHAGDRIAYASTRRNGADRDIYVMNPLQPANARLVYEAKGGGWSISDWSPDDKSLLLHETVSIRESRLWLLDLTTGRAAQLRANEKPAAYAGGQFRPDGKAIYVISDAKSDEFLQLCQIDLTTQEITPLVDDLKWDVEDFDLSHDGKTIAFSSNEAGESRVWLLDAATRKRTAVEGVPRGVAGGLKWHPKTGQLAVAVEHARSSGDVYVFDPKSNQVARWTESELGLLPADELAEPQLVSWPSFDNRKITGFLYQPSEKRFAGPRPVLVVIHGGPEGQSRPKFLGRYNYFINELGMALVFPNVRGSTGYGKTFVSLDDGVKREDSVKDIGALLDWIAKQPGLDARRIVVTGGSYGGYMTLATAVHYSDRIAASIDIVGISDFNTFLKNTESYRRDLRRVEYGDERDPAIRAFFERISPLGHADKIGKPLFVVQGGNDPRVPASEAEQIVAKLRGRNVPVWYLLAKDEGHGFRKKPNADFQFYATVEFIKKYGL